MDLATEVREALETAGKAKWDSTYVSSLPDSSFAYVCPGGERDSDGLTSPRGLRKLPYKDANGNVDLPHTRNALARLNQVECDGKVISQELQDRIRARLQKALGQAKKTLKAISLTLAVAKASRAFELANQGYFAYEVLDDGIVAASYDEDLGVYHKVTYTQDEDGNYAFAPQEEWVRGHYGFVPD